MHKDYDQMLYVNTTNRGTPSDQSPHYNQYEATPYPILHALFAAYELEQTDGFVDFGCGKGRLLYYVHNRFCCSVTGIEMNKQLYEKTVKNKLSYLKGAKRSHGSIQIKCCLAEDYEVKARENKFYFFNPFSIQIFKKVIHNILLSVEKQPREVDVILYYPPIEYTDYLTTETPFELVQEVKVPGLYNINNKECFLIYQYKS